MRKGFLFLLDGSQHFLNWIRALSSLLGRGFLFNALRIRTQPGVPHAQA
jgi:hypothetical protein